ncbi:aminotransferase class I/II-fold pyridoxal phosphate-dependent enzyme, partial [Campylobacter coli]
SALYLALRVLDIGKDDEVIVPSFTFIATAEVVALVGAKPVFVDINLSNYNLDFKAVQKAITPKTKAVIAVSMFGQMSDLRALEEILKDKNIT